MAGMRDFSEDSEAPEGSSHAVVIGNETSNDKTSDRKHKNFPSIGPVSNIG